MCKHLCINCFGQQTAATVVQVDVKLLYILHEDLCLTHPQISSLQNLVLARRDVMLSAEADNTPDIYRFCHIAYDKLTHLKFFGHTILSQEGAHLGDPLSLLLFCLSIYSLLWSCKSHLKIAYMDDVIFGSSAHVVVADVIIIKTEGAPKRLILNE